MLSFRETAAYTCKRIPEIRQLGKSLKPRSGVLVPHEDHSQAPSEEESRNMSWDLTERLKVYLIADIQHRKSESRSLGISPVVRLLI
jgi:hypothetical protein